MFVTHVLSYGSYLKIFGQVNPDELIEVNVAIRQVTPDLIDQPLLTIQHIQQAGDTIFLAKYDKEEYYRCKILKPNSNGTLDVSFIDYGYDATIRINDIRSLHCFTSPPAERLKAFKPQATEYILARVFNNFTAGHIEIIRNEICNKFFGALFEDKIGPYIFISIQHNSSDYSDNLIARNIAKFVLVSDQKDKFLQLLKAQSRFELSQPRALSKTYSNEPPSLPSAANIAYQPKMNYPNIADKSKQMIVTHLSRNKPPAQFDGTASTNATAQSLYVPPALRFQHPPPPSAMNFQSIDGAAYNPMSPYQTPLYNQQQFAQQIYSTMPSQSQLIQLPQQSAYANPDLLQHSSSSSVTHDAIPTFKSCDLMIGQQYIVYCSYIDKGPKSFSVQLKSNEQKLDAMMMELGNVPLTNLQQKPELGMACIARYSEDRQLYRAVIMNIMPTECQVAYVDYGNTEQVAYHDIYEIPKQFLKHSTFANRFALNGYDEFDGVTDSCKMYFKSLIMDAELELFVTPNDSPTFMQYCDLRVNGKNVLEMLKEKLSERPTYLSAQPLTENDFVVIRYIESPKKFYVQRQSNIAEYDMMMDRFMIYCQTASPAKNICIGMACAAEYENDTEWYRVEVLKINGSHALIQYVDFGISGEINVDALKAITFEFLRMPRQATECCLKCFDGIENLSELSRNQLEMLAEDSAGDRRNFKVRLYGTLPDSVYLVNLIDDSTKPVLDLSMRMLKLSMPPKTFRYFEQNKFQTPSTSLPTNANTNSNPLSSRNGGGHDCVINDHEVINSTSVSEMAQQSSNGRGATGRNQHWNDSSSERYNNNSGDSTWNPKRAHFSDTTMWSSKGSDHYESSKKSSSENWDASKKSSDHYDSTKRGSSDHYDSTKRGSSDHYDLSKKSSSENWDASKKSSDHYDSAKRGSSDHYDSSKKSENWDASKKSSDHYDSSKKSSEHWDASREDTRRSITKQNSFIQNRSNNGGNEQNNDRRSEYRPIEPQHEATVYSTWSEKEEHTSATSSSLGYGSNQKNSPSNQQNITPNLDSGNSRDASNGGGCDENESGFGRNNRRSPRNDRNDFVKRQDNERNNFAGGGGDYTKRQPADTASTLSEASNQPEEYIPYNYELPIANINLNVAPIPIIVSWWITPLEFYVYPKTKEMELIDLMKSIQRFYRNKTSIYDNPSIGSYVIARNLQDTKLYRGRVMAYNEKLQKFRVCLIDLGKKAIVSIDDIWEMDKRFTKLPVIVARCTLADILLNLTMEEIQAQIDNYIQPGEAILCEFLSVSDNDIYNVEMSSNGKNLRQSLIDGGLISNLPSDIELPQLIGQHVIVQITQITNLSSFYIGLTGSDTKLISSYTQHKMATAQQPNLLTQFRNQFENQWLPVKIDNLSAENVLMITPLVPLFGFDVKSICSFPFLTKRFDITVSHNERTNILYVQNVKFADNLAQFLEELFEFYENNQGKDMTCSSYTNGYICAAKSSDENWYRASIINVADSQITVKYIDYGNTEIVDRDHVKDLDKSFRNIGAYAARVYLPLLSQFSDNETVINRLTTLTSGYTLYLSILERYNDQWIVDIGLDGMSIIDAIKIEQLGDYLDIKKLREQIDAENVDKLVITVDANVNEQSSSAVNDDQGATSANADEDQLIAAFVSHVDSPERFYLQLKSDQSALDSLQENLQIVAPSLPMLDDFTEGKHCIVKYSIDNLWYRAIIIDSDTKITTIRFIDYGNYDTISDNSMIRSMNDAFVHVQNYAIQCSLPIGCRTNDWPADALKILYDISDVIEFKFICKSPSLNYIELYSMDRDITKELIASGFAVELDRVADNEDCYVSHVNSLADFYIQLYRDTDGLEKMCDYLTNEDNMLPCTDNLTNVKGKMCIAQFDEDDCWYRAKVLDTNEQLTEVLFIDYGNTSFTENVQMFKELEIAELPALAKHCSLRLPDNVREWSAEAERKFAEICDEGRTILTVKVYALGKQTIIDLLFNGESVADMLSEFCVKQIVVHKQHDESVAAIDGQELGFICLLKSVKDFYFQPDSHQQELDLLLTTFENDAADYPILVEKMVGDICVAQFDKDECYYRAKIVEKLSTDEFRVHFIDYGIYATASDIRVVPENIAAIKPLAIHCTIDENESLSDDDINRIYALIDVDQKYTIEIVAQDQQPNVVRLLKNGKNVLDLLDNDNQIEEPQDDLDVDENYVADVFNVTIDGHISGFVCYLTTAKNFYFVPNSHKEELDFLVTTFKNDAADYPILDDKNVDGICVAKFVADNLYYRAKIVEKLSNDSYRVHFIDYGNFAIATDIRIAPENIAAIKPLALHCQIEGSESLELVDAFELFGTLIDYSQKYTIEIVDDNQQPNVVRMHKVGQNIRDEIAYYNPTQSKNVAEIVNQIEEPKCDDLNADQNEDEEDSTVNQYNVDDVQNVTIDGHISGFVCLLTTAKNFYFLPKSHQEELNFLVTTFASDAAGYAILDGNFDDICVALYIEDGHYYRAKIIEKLSENSYRVHFIDYGNFDIVTDLRIAPENIAAIKPLAIHCQIEGSESLTNIDALEQFVKLIDINEKYSIEIVDDNQQPNIVRIFKNGKKIIIDNSSQKVVTETVHQIEELEPCDDSNVDCNQQLSTINEQSAESSDICENVRDDPLIDAFVIFGESPNNFYLQRNDDTDRIEMMVDKLLDAGEFPILTEPKVNTLCVAICADDDVYYRAKILSINDNDNCQVFFIDYGNTMLSNDLRVIPSDLIDIKPLAIHCTLNGINPDSDVAKSNFTNNILTNLDVKYRVKFLSQLQIDPVPIDMYDENDCNIIDSLLTTSNQNANDHHQLSADVCSNVDTTNTQPEITNLVSCTFKESCENLTKEYVADLVSEMVIKIVKNGHPHQTIPTELIQQDAKERVDIIFKDLYGSLENLTALPNENGEILNGGRNRKNIQEDATENVAACLENLSINNNLATDVVTELLDNAVTKILNHSDGVASSSNENTKASN